MNHFLTSKKGARISLAIVLVIFFALFGVFSSAKAPDRNGQSPAESESALVSELLQGFPDADKQSVLIVATSAGGQEATAGQDSNSEQRETSEQKANSGQGSVSKPALSDGQIAALENLKPLLDELGVGTTNGPLTSEDGKAAVLITPVQVGDNNTQTAQKIAEIRGLLSEQNQNSKDLGSLVLHVTGGPAFGADIAAAFDGADFTLLLVTILIVALLLIITYRSPVLWIFPLIAVGLGAGLAGRLTAAAGAQWNLEFDAGIISVLVFGAGTNYALLLISRYREELLLTNNHRDALATAWRATLPAILASNVTVIFALLTLIFADLPMTKGLGVPAAIGLLVALVSIVFLLPPLLAMLGKKIFWPLIPAPTASFNSVSTDSVSADSALEKITAEENSLQTGLARQTKPSFWHTLATGVVHKPVRSLFAGFAVLAIMTTGLLGTSVGLNQLEKFRVASDSATGLEVLSEHFPAGEAQPIFVIVNKESAENVTETISKMPNIVRAHTAAESLDKQKTSILVTSEFAPSTTESFDQIEDLREKLKELPEAQALVGGATATDLDANIANEKDLKLVAPLVLVVSFIILLLLLRSFVAPTLLLIVNLFSAVAAIGAGSWLSRIVFASPAIDPQVPLLAFLFLVALGIDYTIFLVHRARSEAKIHGTREGMVKAVTHTGSVITSAGIVLAAVFAALGVLPLVVLGQLGLIVGFGVLVDTFIVRGVIVPAIFGIIGDRIWWPGSLKR